MTNIIVTDCINKAEVFIKEYNLNPKEWRIIREEKDLRGLKVNEVKVIGVSKNLSVFLNEINMDLNAYINKYCK